MDPSGATAIAPGRLPTTTEETRRVAVSMTLTVSLSESETRTSRPFGLTAMLHGPAPTRIGAPALAGRVVRFTGVTVFSLKSAT